MNFNASALGMQLLHYTNARPSYLTKRLMEHCTLTIRQKRCLETGVLACSYPQTQTHDECASGLAAAAHPTHKSAKNQQRKTLTCIRCTDDLPNRNKRLWHGINDDSLSCVPFKNSQSCSSSNEKKQIVSQHSCLFQLKHTVL